MKARIVIGALTLSASALVGIAVHEGYRGEAYIPVKGDVPTIGFGTTAGVKSGDTIEPVQALVRKLADVQRFEGALKQCVRVPLHQHEYDAWMQFTYNVGPSAFCNSTALRKLNSGDYAGACDEMLRWVYVDGRKVQGLVNRREAERQLCLGTKRLTK
jgi:lysozyme